MLSARLIQMIQDHAEELMSGPFKSSASPKRRIGICWFARSSPWGLSQSACANAVLIRPGQMALTRTPRGPSSPARFLTSAITASFEMLYVPITVLALRPPARF